MKAFRCAALAAASLTLAFAAPAMADDPWPVESGDYVEVSMIAVDDGADLQYMNHLAGQWRKGQDFAKAQGWISGYEILANQNKRPGEPDYYLITRFPRFADKAVMMADMLASGEPRRAFQTFFQDAVSRWVAGAHDAEAFIGDASSTVLEVLRALHAETIRPTGPPPNRVAKWASSDQSAPSVCHVWPMAKCQSMSSLPLMRNYFTDGVEGKG